MQHSQIADNMIRWALGKIGDSQYSGWCLSFIEDALEISNQIEIFGGDCAKESCNMYYDAIQFGEPERGAFVFYDCLCQSEDGIVNWGHCGISLGEGQVIHAWATVRIDDFQQIERNGKHRRFFELDMPRHIAFDDRLFEFHKPLPAAFADI